MARHTNSSTMHSNTASTLTKNHTKPRKKSRDRHRKVDGRDRRIRLPFSCAEIVFALQGKFGHKHPGETVDWIVNQAKPSIHAALNGGRIFMNNQHQKPGPPPMALASAHVPMMFPNASNGLMLPAQNFAGYGTTGTAPVMPQWPPLGFQNGMQISQGT